MRRTIATFIATTSMLSLLAVPAAAATGSPSSGPEPVVAEDRSHLERVAEAYAMREHNAQRTASDPTTRNGATYTDVSRSTAMEGWSDILTVARRWSDRSGLSEYPFAHNPSYHRQYGHWRSAAENIAATTMGPASRSLDEATVRASAEKLLQGLWNSDGHRRNWMNPSFDHMAVGASIKAEEFCFPSGCQDYWTLMLTVNFRRVASAGVPDSWSSFPVDGSLPPNESTSSVTAARDEPSTTDSTSTTSGSSTTSPSSSGPSFSDVPAGHTFAAPIRELAASGVTRGCNRDGTRFCPDRYVTRAQMAAFLTRALDLPAGDASFGDVPKGHTFRAPIAALAESGITRGCNRSGTQFCPDAYVTRAQMAAFLTRALDLPAGDATFRDVPRGHTFRAPIAALAESGITRGCNKGGTEFCPDSYVTRAQMAAFLSRSGLLD